MSQRIDFFLIWLTQSIDFFAQRIKPFFSDMTWTLLTWLKDLRTFFLHDSKTSTFCEPSCEHDSRIWASFYMTQRIELFFLEYDSKNWTFSGIWLNGLFFEKINSNNWTLFYVTHRIEPFPNMTHRIEPFPNMTHRIEPFLNMTQRIEPFCIRWLTELNPFAKYYFFEKIWLTELNVSWNNDSKNFLMSQIFELSPLSICLTELNHF